MSDGQAHGYELLDAIRAAGLRSAEAGGLYRCLRTMEEDELVTSWWEPSQHGPPRRTYVLTDEGLTARHAAVDALDEVRQLLEGLIDGRRNLSTMAAS
ncbi:MAG: PadR family transcriptional regulator [Actinomycetota bacterium]|nr:PadR family transcriptional regulator [Actinomycetota bacterium]